MQITAQPNLEHILHFFKQSAIDMGKFQLANQPTVKLESKGEGEPSSPKDAITEVDRYCQELILRNAIQEGLNELGLLAEENTPLTRLFNPSSSYKLVVDPLDGTQNYAKGDEKFGVSLGLMKDDEFVVGVIYVPKREALFGAIAAKGAYKFDMKTDERHPIQIKKTDLAHVILGYKVSDQVEQAINKLGIRTSRPKCAVFIAYSILTDNPKEHANAFLSKDSYLWDIGPGAFIIKEAGGYYELPGSNKWNMGRALIPSCIISNSYSDAKALGSYLR